MKTLELNQMEIIKGSGPCDGQIAAFGLATSSVAYSLVGGIFGLLLATAALSIAVYNLEQCQAVN